MLMNYVGKKILHKEPSKYKSAGTDDFFDIDQVYTIDAVVWFEDHCVYFTKEVPDIPYTGQFQAVDGDVIN